jgi:hypothetical protein
LLGAASERPLIYLSQIGAGKMPQPPKPKAPVPITITYLIGAIVCGSSYPLVALRFAQQIVLRGGIRSRRAPREAPRENRPCLGLS